LPTSAPLSPEAMWGAAMDVGGWLRNLGLDKYEAVFRENGIDEQVLRHVTAEDLREIGVATVGDRRKLLAAIAGLAASSPSTELRPPLSPAVRPRAAEVSAERRPITVMFCDLVGSTSLAAKLDAEDWRNLVNVYLDTASEAVTQMGGCVAKKLGDGLMALFGYPKAQENDARRDCGRREPRAARADFLVELRGFEPRTSAVRASRVGERFRPGRTALSASPMSARPHGRDAVSRTSLISITGSTKVMRSSPPIIRGWARPEAIPI
jgi:SAM domain (Sterile alpha motif)/Adenylate and Guanylate cyclase catalytic domain